MRLNLKFESYCILRWARGKVLSVIEMGNWAPQTVRRSRNPPSARNSGVEGPLDRQNLVITFMLLVKQCNWTSLLAGLAFLLSCFPAFCLLAPSKANWLSGSQDVEAQPILSCLGMKMVRNGCSCLGKYRFPIMQQPRADRCRLMCCVMRQDIEKSLDQDMLKMIFLTDFPACHGEFVKSATISENHKNCALGNMEMKIKISFLEWIGSSRDARTTPPLPHHLIPYSRIHCPRSGQAKQKTTNRRWRKGLGQMCWVFQFVRR